MAMISIIVPVYNVEQYLSRCIDSILNQTFTDFELLLIDDGSPDKSGEICDEYALKDSRIRVFHKDNGGVSSARNLGLDNANGEWIYFVDADDMLYKDALETLFSRASNNIDSVIGGFTRFGANIKDIKVDDIEAVWCYKKALLDFYHPIYQYNNWYLWNRLFRHSIINNSNLRFNEDIYFKEDGLFVVKFLCMSKQNVYVTTKPVYKYFINRQGAMRSLLYQFNEKYLTNLDARISCYLSIKKVTSYCDVRLRFHAIFSVIKIYVIINDLLKKFQVNDTMLIQQTDRKISKNISWILLLVCRLYVLALNIKRKYKLKKHA